MARAMAYGRGWQRWKSATAVGALEGVMRLRCALNMLVRRTRNYIKRLEAPVNLLALVFAHKLKLNTIQQ